MASYTDTSQALTQFNPYVQQLPVEAMVAVGQQKQAQYDQGVQKIQSHIEQIAGMDIVRDVDKKYLQSKLQSLGDNLTTVAAGDFSNYQLVNSVGGMISKIGKDNNIINAVGSTAKYRKEVANMEAARKDGKSAIQNEWDFANKANSWLFSSKIKQGFNDSYTPFIDVEKKWIDVVKSLHSDLRDVDIAYELNPDGSPNYKKTLAAMQRVSKETVSAEKIETALRASLSPDEMNQLSIDGRYTFKDMDQPSLQRYATSKYTSLISENESKIKALEGVANLSTSDSTKRDLALKSIESLKKNNVDLSQNIQKEIDFILKNPEEAKSYIYKNGAIAQFSRAHSWEHSKENLMTNPVAQAEQWEKKFALDLAQFQETKDKNAFDKVMSMKDYDLKAKKALQETFGVDTPFTTYLGQSTAVKSPKVAMLNDIDSNESAINSTKQTLIKELGITKEQLDNAILAYQEGDSEKVASANKAIPVEWRDEVNNIIDLTLKNKRVQSGITKVEEDIRSSEKFSSSNKQVLESVAELPNVVISTPQGQMSFSDQEIIDYLSKEKTTDVNLPTGYVIATDINRPLTLKEEALQNAIASGQSNALLDRYRKIAGNKVKDLSKQYDEAVNEELLKRGGQYIPRLSNITFSSEDGGIAKATWDNIAGAVLLRYQNTGVTAGGAATASPSDIEKARTWLGQTDKKDIQYKKLVQGNQTNLVISKGNEEVIVPLTGEEISQLPLIDQNEPDPVYRDLVQAQAMGSGSSNPTGKPQDAYFQRFQMPNIKSLNVVADLTQNKSNPGKNYINLQIKLPSGWTTLKVDSNPVTREAGMRVIQNLTDEQVKQLFLTNPTVSENTKQEILSIQ